jgi:hypothetical protein
MSNVWDAKKIVKWITCETAETTGISKTSVWEFAVEVHGAHWWYKARKDEVREYVRIAGTTNTMALLEVLYGENSMNFILETNHEH